jgi:hypothetical protein
MAKESMKSKMMSSGGAKGYAVGGMINPSAMAGQPVAMAKGGAVKTKMMAGGGAVKTKMMAGGGMMKPKSKGK